MGTITGYRILKRGSQNAVDIQEGRAIVCSWKARSHVPPLVALLLGNTLISGERSHQDFSLRMASSLSKSLCLPSCRPRGPRCFCLLGHPFFLLMGIEHHLPSSHSWCPRNSSCELNSLLGNKQRRGKKEKYRVQNLPKCFHFCPGSWTPF